MRNNNFDLLRLYAALEVVLTHGLRHLYQDFGYQANKNLLVLHKVISYVPGVPIFFLISGYLIFMSYEKNSNLVDYAKNRLLRILPALYVNVTIGILILVVFGFVTFNLHFFIWLLGQLTIVQFYNIDMFRGFGVGVINGSLWTISVELTFYILLPFLFVFYQRNIVTRFVLLGLSSASFMLWIYDVRSNKDLFVNKLIHSTIFPYLFIFIIGMTFYRYRKCLLIYIKNKFIYWLLLFVISQFIYSYYEIENTIPYFIINWAILAFLIFSAAFSFGKLSQKLLKRNDYTYGIYVYHMLVINIMVHLNYVDNTYYLGIVFFITVALAALSWHLIEKPFLSLKKKSVYFERSHNDKS